jgi:hypothetical protein
MDRRNSSGLAGPAVIIALLAALGLGPALRGSQTPAAAPSAIAAGGMATSFSAAGTSSTDEYESNGGYAHGAGYLLEKFFDRLSDPAEKSKAWASDVGKFSSRADFDPEDLRSQYTADCLIVTLPTPISPPLRYFFDSARAALESAAGTSGYSLDSFDLPWSGAAQTNSGKFQLGSEIDVFPAEPAEIPAPAPQANQSADSAKYLYSLKPNTDNDNRWRRDCGVILFRDEDKHRILVVFVVGEAPTYGVNRLELRDALDQMAWLEDWRKTPTPPRRRPAQHLVTMFRSGKYADAIRIVGPTFSGSAPSLRNVLEDWRYQTVDSLKLPKRLSIEIISGTATSIGNSTLPVAKDPRRPAVFFKTVQIPDSVLRKEIPQLLENVAEVPAGAPTPVAPANVSGSATANCSPTPMSAVQSTPETPRIAIIQENTASENPKPEAWIDGTLGDSSEGPQILLMSFPLHISQLRALQKGNNGQQPSPGRRDVDLPDESGQQSIGVIAPYSPRAATYNELVLNNLLSRIHRARVRYVGIVATDVEDLVFLVQEIRASCPDVVVFTTSADIRFLHSEVNTDMRGTLVFTTYPLFERLQAWTSPFQSKMVRTFPSDTAQGVYNAVLAQLSDKPELMLNYGQPFDSTPADKDHPKYPVLQIGVVGRSDIWPIAFWVPDHGDLGEVWGNTTQDEHRKPFLGSSGGLYPPAFEALFFILNVVLGMAASTLLMTDLVPLWQRMPMRDWLTSRCKTRWWLAFLLKDPTPELRDARHVFTMTIFAGMLMAEIVGLSFVHIPIRIAPTLLGFPLLIGWTFRVILYGEYLIGVLVLVAWIVSTIRMFACWRGGRWTQFWHPVLYLGLGLIPVALALGLWWHLRNLPTDAEALFAFIRAVHLYDGVSPLMALMFLGGAGSALAACYFFRAAMLEDRPLRNLLLDANGESASFRGVAGLEERVVHLLKISISSEYLPAAILVLGLLVVSFLYFGLTKLRTAFSIDGEAFDILFICMTFAIYAMFSFALLRFALTWFAIRRLLRRLYFHPSRYSYKDIQLTAHPSHLEHQKILLYEARPGLAAVEYGLGRARAVLWMAAQTGKHSALADSINQSQTLNPTLLEAERQLEELQKVPDWEASVSARKNLYWKVAGLTAIIVSLFEPVWRMSNLTPRLNAVDDKSNTVDEKATTDTWLLHQAELFMAVRVVDFVRHVFPHLINLVGFAMPAVLAMVLAVSAYPFPAHDTLLWVSWTVLLATIGLTLYVFIGINRNPILSMITGNEPGQFNWNSAFTMHLLLFAVIPILTLLGAQYPGALSGGLSWVGSVFSSGGTSQ